LFSNILPEQKEGVVGESFYFYISYTVTEY
jgi:hypothetical protein